MLKSGIPSRFAELIRRPLLLLFVPVLLCCFVYTVFLCKEPVLPAEDGDKVTLSGTVRDKTLNEDGSLKEFVMGDVLVRCKGTDFDREPVIGSEVCVTGTLRCFKSPMNRGGFDELKYHRARGENYAVVLSEAREIKAAVSTLRDELCKLKYRLAALVTKYCPLEYGTIKTLILGDKSSLSDERKNLYQRVSLSHFLVISGLHISAAAGALYRVLITLFRRKSPASFATLAFLLLYGLLIGFSVSVLRAVLMYAVRLLADLTGETYDSLSAASLAGIVTLIHNPLLVTDTSFLYSYIAVFTIGFYYDSGPVTGFKGFREKLKDALRFSLVMVFGMFPVTMYFSGTYSLGALLLNLFIIPFGPVMLFFAFMAFVFSAFSLAVPAAFFDFLEACLIRLTDFVAGVTAKGAWLRLSGQPHIITVLACYGVLLLYLYRWQKRMPSLSGFLLLSGIFRCVSAVWWYSPGLSMLYVGQGECMVLRTGMRSAAILDCGSTSDSEVYRYDLLPYLYCEGINRIEGVFVSHSDKDHVSGVKEMFADLDTSGLSVKRLLLPGLDSGGDPKLSDLLAEAKERNVSVYYLTAGDRVEFGNWNFECLWPVRGRNLGDANEDSLVLKGVSGSLSVLLTGDISDKTERAIISCFEEDRLRAGVLKVAHHGSQNATSEVFLSAVNPTVAIASAGIKNRYSHPSEAVRGRLEEFGVNLYCTKETGEIDLRISEYKNKLILKSYKTGR